MLEQVAFCLPPRLSDVRVAVSQFELLCGFRDRRGNYIHIVPKLNN